MHMMTEAKGNPHALRGPSILYAEGRIYREAFPQSLQIENNQHEYNAIHSFYIVLSCHSL
jgi:hypothetical protein